MSMDETINWQLKELLIFTHFSILSLRKPLEPSLKNYMLVGEKFTQILINLDF